MRMRSWPLFNKRIFLRTDLNTNQDPFLFTESLKFKGLLATLAWIKKSGGRVTLVTHKGRPHGFESNLSTQPLAHFFNERGFSCIYTTPEDITTVINGDYDIILLENIRFYREEYSNSLDFAKKITTHCTYFVEDGFGVLERNETSITTAARLFTQENRSIGLHVEDELNHLQQIKTDPQKPYLIILAGAKGVEKLPILYNFFDKATHIALGPAVSEVAQLPDFLSIAKKHSIHVMLPRDFIYYKNRPASIGPHTVALWKPIIQQMRTIVYNGMMGFSDEPETVVSTREILNLCATNVDAHTIIAGGDTTTAAQQWHITGPQTFFSTGGGTTLAYLGGLPLPGLEVI